MFEWISKLRLAPMSTDAILNRLTRQRAQPLPRHRENYLQQPSSILYLGMVATVMLTLPWVALLLMPDGDSAALLLIALPLSLLGPWLIAEYLRSVHLVNAAGMRYGRSLGWGGRFRWTDVEWIDFHQKLNWYRITLASGATVRVSGTLRGQPTFARYVLTHVPAERIDPSAHAMLVDAEQGRLHVLQP